MEFILFFLMFKRFANYYLCTQKVSFVKCDLYGCVIKKKKKNINENIYF